MCGSTKLLTSGGCNSIHWAFHGSSLAGMRLVPCNSNRGDAATQPPWSTGHTGDDPMRDEVGPHSSVMKTHNRKPCFSGSTTFASSA